MSNLRNKIIRLAHQNPELRKDLLPLLSKTAKNIEMEERGGQIYIDEKKMSKKEAIDFLQKAQKEGFDKVHFVSGKEDIVKSVSFMLSILSFK